MFLLYKGLSVPVTLTYGDKSLVGPLLAEIYHRLPDRFYTHAWEGHLPGLQEHYECDELSLRLRMVLGRDAFTRQPVDGDVVRLGHRDTARIVSLYDHYPDNFFEPYQLETGLYFGLHDGPGGPLISIGGIHVLSAEYDVAAIGNLVTHPAYRGRNLAKRVTSRLLNEVFERVSLVALNVSEENHPAVRLYEGFGFAHNHRFYEGMVRRRMIPTD